MVNLIKFLSWYQASKTVFSVHSPRLFDFCNDVVDDNRHYYAFDRIEFVCDILCKANKIRPYQPDIGRSLFRTVLWWQPARIVSIGSEQNAYTAYLASAYTNCPVHILDFKGQNREVARDIWKKVGLTNIRDLHLLKEETFSEMPELGDGKTMVVIQHGLNDAQIIHYLNLLALQLKQPFMVIFMDIRRSKATYKAWQNGFGRVKSGAWIDLYHTGIWLSEDGFLEPISISLCPKKWKPLRLGWI